MERILTGISGVSLLLALVLSQLNLLPILVPPLYFISISSGSYFIIRDALKELFNQKFLNINFLVTTAALGAIYINQLAEAAAVVFFFSLAEMFEELGIERSRRALEILVKKSPQTATLKNGQQVPVEKVKINDTVIVRPGDLIPLDRTVVKGSSSINEATITSESLPKDKRKNDTVFASTFNQNGYLEIKVTQINRNSTFAKIIKLVEQAQQSHAPAQEFIDRFARYYTPLVVTGAILITLIPPFFFGGTLTDWLYRGPSPPSHCLPLRPGYLYPCIYRLSHR